MNISVDSGVAPSRLHPIAQWCQSIPRGTRVRGSTGTYECSDLADVALIKHGYMGFHDFGINEKLGDQGDYVWGRCRRTVNDVRSGDIIQFNHVHYVYNNKPCFAKHHTAVVADIGRGYFILFEQNAPIGNGIRLSTFALNTVSFDRGGNWRAWQPMWKGCQCFGWY